ncbi:MAG TPA: sodium-translocating pyrophosphatase [Lentisphaeria bacterium]|nr:MAG: sodium-translocating pyrophosphatase [Lentisphaerae bacterium GWF2_49_21]HBC86205.1 sodium-translocating pyrophosphatase [Lentisphaeria bacterium]
MRMKRALFGCSALLAAALCPTSTLLASEAELKLPDLSQVKFLGGSVTGTQLMLIGIVVCAIGLVFGLVQYVQTRNLPVHKSMSDVSNIIWETCKSYLAQQGKFLAVLWVLIAICMVYYFGFLTAHEGKSTGTVVLNVIIILAASVLGILGSYGVAWFGMRLNTFANSRSAFASLRGTPWQALAIPMRSGMSVGLLLVTVELFFMICILVLLPSDIRGACFIGFAIGESLGASALRICGGIFTKIADIGSDLMKIVFKLPEDDPKNPGVVADCTGDNAGDSVGPTADGFETYGVTGVALIAFLALVLGTSTLCAQLIVWLFVMRILMILTSMFSYFINEAYFSSKLKDLKEFDPEHPLTVLVWLTSIVSIGVTYLASYFLIGSIEIKGVAQPNLWWVLSTIISCGTIAGALIPEFTKVFTSTNAKHVKEVVTASKQGGASLNILSGFVAGNFSAFWEGLTMLVLMLIAALLANNPAVVSMMPVGFEFAAPIFAFGLVAFGFLGMGPVTIAVDSFGPVSDNAQSVYELSRIESIPGIREEIKKDFGFEPDFERAKLNLERNDGAGNTFKATAKPVLIGTAVVGATTMIFGIIIMLARIAAERHGGNVGEMIPGAEKATAVVSDAALKAGIAEVIGKLSLVQPEIILGLLMGGAVIYWFTGAATQAVVTGAYRAVVYIKENMNLNAETASIKDSKEVVKICTIYAQKGMFNIFIAIFCFALSLAFFNPFFFIGYLISIAFFGLFQAIFMANAGGAWDNAKKIVEVDLRQKGTDLHAACVIGDTVGDPFKDTSSVAMNPIIKFTTLFGLLAVEIAVSMKDASTKYAIGGVLFIVALTFVYRSFYCMRIPEDK